MAKKIESLTREQEAALESYRQEWLTIGRSTEPADRATAERVLTAMYGFLGKKKPYLWWSDGPATGSMVRTIFRSNQLANLVANLRANLLANLGANLVANLRDNLRDNLWANLGANLRDNLVANLGANLVANLRANLRANLLANLWDNLLANLWDNLRANLLANLRANLRANLGDNLSWGFWGSHESYWPAYYAWPHLTLREIHSKDQAERLQWWLDLSKSCGWWEPFEGIVFVCERPQVQKINARGQLHCDGGPAMLCRDGWPVWALNNVRVPQWLAETKAEDIQPQKLAEIDNAEVRREFVRKVGVERCFYKLGTVISKQGNYELGELEVVPGSKRIYLKMLNPSVGCWHLEAVHPSCRTVQQAINWRRYGDVSKEWKPEVLT